jgi:hypothetical protein
MITSMGLATNLPIDADIAQTLRQRGAQQEVIQAQAGIARPTDACLEREGRDRND